MNNKSTSEPKNELSIEEKDNLESGKKAWYLDYLCRDSNFQPILLTNDKKYDIVVSVSRDTSIKGEENGLRDYSYRC